MNCRLQNELNEFVSGMNQAIKRALMGNYCIFCKKKVLISSVHFSFILLCIVVFVVQWVGRTMRKIIKKGVGVGEGFHNKCL